MCFDKSMYTIVAMMATLKAGGACVHLGKNSPIDRMSEIIGQTGASIVLTDNVHAHKFNGVTEAIVVDRKLLSSLHSTTRLPVVSPSNPAFVLFTSGSTGKPKGVVVEHGSLCTSSRAHGTNRKVGPWTRLLQFAAYTFDVSVADIFTTLQRGGCICVPSEDERINDLPGAINRMSCNYGFLTPTVASMLDPATVPTLKRLILGGELLTQDNVQQWAPRVDLIISYGMTECSIHCVDAVPLTIESDPADLGRPSGCHMWIVDPENHNNLAPIGAVGELVIEGRMVSRGYLGDKAKTDAAFIVDPTWSQGTGRTRRMYKTGDLCKYSAEGTICYVSRKDFQVKHHGQRIELSEIEHHIVADTRVNQAVVLLPKAGYLQKRLVAVLSLEALAQTLTPETQLALVSGLEKGIAEVQISAVRNYLATKVPDYMVPAVWVVVRAMPLTPNNKMDRVTTTKWLVEMDGEMYESIVGGEEEEGGAPATEQQKRLHDILCAVLGLPSINMSRSFLDLGGDSIAAMNLRAKCQPSGISLSVRDILTCESISHLAVMAKFSGDEEEEEGPGKPFPLTVWQKTLLEKEVEEQTLSLHLEIATTIPKLVRAVEALVQHHAMLRARFSHDASGNWTQFITREISTSYRIDAQTVAKEADVKACVAGYESHLDIENGPLFALRLFDFEDGLNSQVLVLNAHPVVADTASIRILVQDLRGLLQGNVLPVRSGVSYQSALALNQPTVRVDAPAIDLVAWGIEDRSLLSKDIVKNSITLPSGVTCSLLGTANRSLSTQPTDILIAVLVKIWSTVFGRCPSIAVKDDARKDRIVGQYSRIRQVSHSHSNDLVRLLSEVKDDRAFENLGTSLMSALPDLVEILVESFDYTTLGGEEALRRPSLLIPAVLAVSAIVTNGEITINFTYSAKIAQHETIASFIGIAEQTIPTVASALSSMSCKPTLSDFPLLDIDYPHLVTLEKILADINTPYSNVEAIVPCTPLQQRMLNSQKQTLGAYQSDTAHKITTGGDSQLDVARLQDAWKMVTARHEALRTIFIPSVSRNFESDQLVLKLYEPTINVIECDDANVHRIIANHHTVSHSSYKPHVGFTVFQTPTSFYSKLEISHALQDGMSTRIIYQDLVLAYQEWLPRGVAPGFREYVDWLLQHDMSHSDEFWGRYLEDATPCNLPRKIEDAFEKGSNVLIPIQLDATAEEVNRLCRKYKITSATLFQAAWVLVLRTVAATDDVLFGYLTANRELNISGIDELVGPMINMLACRLTITSTTSITSLLKQTHDSFLETLEHQHRFVSVASNKESLDGELPFNSVLSIEYASEEGAQAYYPTAGEGKSNTLGFETVDGTRAPEFDVVLGVLLGDSNIEVQLGYWDGVIDEMLMERVSRMYKEVIEEMVGGKGLDATVSQVRALTV
tara:strand:+ start:27 stop:4247 length:4221 start_codon:yes stop_codon:yes gene_type:complete